MQKVPLAPGIAGSVLAVVNTVTCFVIGSSYAHLGEFIPQDPGLYARLMAKPLEPQYLIFLVPALISLIAAAAGVAGVLLLSVFKRCVPAGVLMIIGGALILLTVLGVAASILFIAGGRLALSRSKNTGDVSNTA